MEWGLIICLVVLLSWRYCCLSLFRLNWTEWIAGEDPCGPTLLFLIPSVHQLPSRQDVTDSLWINSNKCKTRRARRLNYGPTNCRFIFLLTSLACDVSPPRPPLSGDDPPSAVTSRCTQAPEGDDRASILVVIGNAICFWGNFFFFKRLSQTTLSRQKRAVGTLLIGSLLFPLNIYPAHTFYFCRCVADWCGSLFNGSGTMVTVSGPLATKQLFGFGDGVTLSLHFTVTSIASFLVSYVIIITVL